MKGTLTENEKAIGFALLFPIFWPFLPVLLICILFENIGHKYRAWKWHEYSAKFTDGRLVGIAQIPDPDSEVSLDQTPPALSDKDQVKP